MQKRHERRIMRKTIIRRIRKGKNMKKYVTVEYDKVNNSIKNVKIENVKKTLKMCIENNTMFAELLNEAAKYKEENELYKKILEDLENGIPDKDFIRKCKELAVWTEYRDIFISRAGNEDNMNVKFAEDEEKDIEYILKGIWLYFKAYYNPSYAQEYEEYKEEYARKEKEKKELKEHKITAEDFLIPMN